jgi:hypothetical protein
MVRQQKTADIALTVKRDVPILGAEISHRLIAGEYVLDSADAI